MAKDGNYCSSIEVAVSGFARGFGSGKTGAARRIVECVAEVPCVVVGAHRICRTKPGSGRGIMEDVGEA